MLLRARIHLMPQRASPQQRLVVGALYSEVFNRLRTTYCITSRLCRPSAVLRCRTATPCRNKTNLHSALLIDAQELECMFASFWKRTFHTAHHAKDRLRCPRSRSNTSVVI